MSFEVLILKYVIMKNLIQITAILFLLVQTIGFSQTITSGTNPNKKDTILKEENTKMEIEIKKFIGKYLLVEGGFELEIIEENNMMYIVSPFSKDLLILINETKVREPTRGVDLELIKNDKKALKYTQNGYETIIKRIDTNEEN